MMKKRSILIILIFIVLLMPSVSYAKSNTLGELKQELASLKSQKSSANANKNKTQSELNSAKNTIASKHSEILENQEAITNAQNEIESLTREIEDGKDELVKLLQAYQMLQNDNIYLDYVFDADNYDEIISRYAAANQLITYIDNKIKEWNNKINYNNQLKADLAAKEIELNNQIDALNKDVKKLNTSLADLNDMVLDIDAEIKSVESTIKYYDSVGCKDNQLLSDCLKIYGDSHFRLPTSKGVITDEFGYRVHPITGKAQSFHTGIDIGLADGNNVYAAANGTVSKLTIKSSCGGNMVYIQHLVNGKKYTTTYMHLLEIKVKVGDVVTSDTVIGLSGGGKTKSYDTCTTGGHLHFSVATDWYGVDYLTYNQWVSHTINPRNVLTFKSSWSSR